MGKRCQSCGMPISKDPEGGGSETDGSRSAKYCSITAVPLSSRENCVTIHNQT